MTVKRKSAMTPERLRNLRTSCVDKDTYSPLTQGQAAKRLGVTPNTFARWERGEIPMPVTAARLARLVLRSDFDIGDLDDG